MGLQVNLSSKANTTSQTWADLGNLAASRMGAGQGEGFCRGIYGIHKGLGFKGLGLRV